MLKKSISMKENQVTLPVNSVVDSSLFKMCCIAHNSPQDSAIYR